MSMASDLMGLGLSPHLARRIASGGAGSASSLQIAAAGAAQSTATAIGGQQYLVSVNSGTGGVILPALGGDNGCLLGDEFFVNNATGSGVVLYAETAVNLSFGGSNIAGSTGISLV